MKRIVITGPESSGKTTVAKGLAAKLKGTVVPEFARTYLESCGCAYQLRDLPLLLQGQTIWEDWYAKQEENWLIVDTDWTVIQVWADVVYPGHTLELPRRAWDYAFLCAPDMPWESDPLRENPDDRWVLFGHYQALLEENGAPFSVLTGGEAERLERAVEILGCV